MDSLKRGKILIEFDGFYRILSNFARMFKNGLGMKKHIHIFCWLVMMMVVVGCKTPPDSPAAARHPLSEGGSGFTDAGEHR